MTERNTCLNSKVRSLLKEAPDVQVHILKPLPHEIDRKPTCTRGAHERAYLKKARVKKWQNKINKKVNN